MAHKFTITSADHAEVTISTVRDRMNEHVELSLAEDEHRGTATLAVRLRMDDAMRLAEVMLSIARHRPSRD